MSNELTPKQKWEALKARGNPTDAEIEAIDAETPWREVEPKWWCEMMDYARQQRIKATGGQA